VLTINKYIHLYFTKLVSKKEQPTTKETKNLTKPQKKRRKCVCDEHAAG